MTTNNNGITSVFNDFGDGTERACVSIDYPVISTLYMPTDAVQVVTFTAGTVALVDFYVEFS